MQQPALLSKIPEGHLTKTLQNKQEREQRLSNRRVLNITRLYGTVVPGEKRKDVDLVKGAHNWIVVFVYSAKNMPKFGWLGKRKQCCELKTC